MTRPHTDLRPEDITAIIDTRERLPLDLKPLSVVRGGLPTGDYSVRGLENEIAVERKSLADLVMCCGAERDRFEREVQRLLAYQCRLLVVEATWTQIEAGGWRGQLTPAHVRGALFSWMAVGLPVLTIDDHKAAGLYVARFLFLAARRRWNVLRSFLPELKLAVDIMKPLSDSAAS